MYTYRLQEFPKCRQSSKVGRLLDEMGECGYYINFDAKCPTKKLDLNKAQTVVLPCYHRVSKPVPQKFRVTIAFGNDYSLASLIPYMYTSAHGCDFAHSQRNHDSVLGVVYSFPLRCGSCYIGQTARCVSLRLM